MQKKRKIGFILEAIVVFILIAVLSSVAVPRIGRVVDDEQGESRAEELDYIQAAVTAMLEASPSGALKPVGPTRDMNQVVTDDITPLVLASYLDDNGAFTIESDCYYTFSADGTVTQECP